MFICNFTPVDRADYCVGVPVEGTYKRILTNYSYLNENHLGINFWHLWKLNVNN